METAASTSTRTTPVWVNDGTSGLGARVLRRLLASDRARAADPAECEVLVWLSAHDADARASRRESALQGLSGALADCPRLTHVVLVSSAMVYGAWANNPVPLTEDAVLRPDVEFAYARQLGAVEQLVDDWRRAVPGRSVTVLRPVVSMAADGTSGIAGRARGWHGSARR